MSNISNSNNILSVFTCCSYLLKAFQVLMLAAPVLREARVSGSTLIISDVNINDVDFE